MIEQIQNLLPSLSTCHSVRYKVSGENKAGKKHAQYNLIRQPVSDAVLQAHFNGDCAVSLQPLLDTGNTAQWGAIDVDVYGQEELAGNLEKRLKLLGFTAFVEQSKSKGAHIYFLLDRPVIAKPFRLALKKIAGWLGQPDAEIRPSCDSIVPAEGDVGTLMVLPGFGQGEAVLDKLAKVVQSVESFNELTAEGDLIDGPPCLFPLQQLAAVEGWKNRNLFMYQTAVFLRYKYPGDWQDRVREYHEDNITPVLEEGVEGIIGQLEKNNRCHYRCKDAFFEATCNKPLCQTRRFGVKAAETGAVISQEGITVMLTDPPTWFMTLIHPLSGETVRVKLTTDQLYSVAHFKKRVLEELRIIPTLPNQKDWEAALVPLLQKAVTVPVPFEMTEKARVLDTLYKFMLSAPKTEVVDNILRSRMYVQQDSGGRLVGIFRLVDFASYIDRVRLRNIASKDLFNTLSELAELGHITRTQLEVAMLKVDVWAVPMNSTYMQMKAELDLE